MKKHTFKMLTAAFLAGTMLLASTGCSNKPVSSAPSSAAAAGGAGFLRWKGDNPHWRWPKFQCKLYNICRHWKSDHEG